MSYYSLTPEREKELIEKIARFIVDNEFSSIAEIVLRSFGVTDYFGMVGFINVYPWMAGLLGQTGAELTELMGLNPRMNSTRILERVKELEEEKERLKEQARKVEGNQPTSFLSKLKNLFSGKRET